MTEPPESSTTSSTPSRSRPEIEDPSSPFYLHPADGPGITLVAEKLDDKNYQTWSKAMIRSLTVKNKLCFIDPSFTRPTDDPTLANYWDRNNMVVITWILNSLSRDINHTVHQHTIASTLWKELKTMFQQANGPRLFQLHRDLLQLHQQALSVNTYYSKIKVIWDEICNFRPKCTCGQLDQYFEQFYLIIFLMGLQESLSHTRSQLLLMDPLPDVTKAYSLISQEETQISITANLPTTDHTNSMAFASKSNPQFTPYRPPNPNLSSNTYRPSPPTTPNTYRPNSRPPYNPNRPNRPYCSHCQMPGHTITTCFKIHGFPPGYRSPNPRFQNPPSTQINNISTDPPQPVQEVQSLLHSMTSEQLHQLTQLLNTHTNNPSTPSTSNTDTPTSHSCTVNTHTGQDIFDEDWQG